MKGFPYRAKDKNFRSFHVHVSHLKLGMLSNLSGMGPENKLFSMFLINKKHSRKWVTNEIKCYEVEYTMEKSHYILRHLILNSNMNPQDCNFLWEKNKIKNCDLEEYKSLRGTSCKTFRVPDNWLVCKRLPKIEVSSAPGAKVDQIQIDSSDKILTE